MKYDTSKLKPCPLCGSTWINLNGNEHALFFNIVCTDCRLETYTHKGLENIIRYWNNRPDLTGEG